MFKSIKEAEDTITNARLLIEYAEATIQEAQKQIGEAEAYIDNQVTEADIYPGAVFRFRGDEFGIPVVLIKLHGTEEYITTGCGQNNPAHAWVSPKGTPAQLVEYFNKHDLYRSEEKLAIVPV